MQHAGKAGAASAAIRFRCPHCQIRVEVDAKHAGAAADCPSCEGQLVVPDESNLNESSSPVGSSTVPAHTGTTSTANQSGQTPGSRLPKFAKAAAREMRVNLKIAALLFLNMRRCLTCLGVLARNSLLKTLPVGTEKEMEAISGKFFLPLDC